MKLLLCIGHKSPVTDKITFSIGEYGHIDSESQITRILIDKNSELENKFPAERFLIIPFVVYNKVNYTVYFSSEEPTFDDLLLKCGYLPEDSDGEYMWIGDSELWEEVDFENGPSPIFEDTDESILSGKFIETNRGEYYEIALDTPNSDEFHVVVEQYIREFAYHEYVAKVDEVEIELV